MGAAAGSGTGASALSASGVLLTELSPQAVLRVSTSNPTPKILVLIVVSSMDFE
jgi:hypothetical protein